MKTTPDSRPRPLNILTFNWHEAYICLLAETGHCFDVVQREKAGLWFWLHSTRPVPPNVSLTHPADARRRLSSSTYDVVVCHNLADLQEVAPFEVPIVLVFHNYRQTELALSTARGSIHPAEQKDLMRLVQERTKPVFISQGKRESWGLEGLVILPGVDIDTFSGYRGEQLRALRVGNFLIERDIMLAGRLQQRVLQGIPHTTYGINQSITSSRLSPSFQALLAAYRSHRVYLHTSREGYEDGYNLALLEAMATGMPVISLRHSGSPVEHGVSGWLYDEAEDMRRGMLELLSHSDKARRMGQAGRDAIAHKFSLPVFVERWQEVFDEVARTRRESNRLSGVRLQPRETLSTDQPLGLLLLYNAVVGDEVHYLDRAFRKTHRVVTAGQVISEDEGQRAPKDWQPPQDIPYSGKAALAEIRKALPPGFHPDLALWMDTGIGDAPFEMQQDDIPTACYVLDPRPHLDGRRVEAFDLKFAARKSTVSELRHQGLKVAWLPLACDPEIHTPASLESAVKIVFVGEPRNPEQKDLLMGLSKRHSKLGADVRHVEPTAEGSSAESNRTASMDACVIELLAAQCFVLAVRSEQDGLEDLFVDGRHLAFCNRGDIIERLRYYLDRPVLCRTVARQGQSEVLRHHTFDHRAEVIVQEFRRWQSSSLCSAPSARAHSTI